MAQVDNKGVFQSPVSGGGAPIIAGFGDSFIRAGYLFMVPWNASVTGSITGLAVEGMGRDTTAGIKTLTYTGGTRSVVYDGGPSTPLVNGFQVIPGATANTGIGVSCNLAGLTGSNQTLTSARSGSRPDQILSGRSILGWLNTFSGQGYKVKNFAHSGGMWGAGLNILERASNFGGFVVNYGTNDVNAGRTLAQMKADATAFMDALYARCRIGKVFGVSYLRTGYSTTQWEKIEQFNRWLAAKIRLDYPGVSYSAPWNAMSDDTGIALRSVASQDGLHPTDALAQLAALDAWCYFRYALPPQPFDFGITAGKYSATNPSGNRFANTYPTGNSAGAPTNWGAPLLGTGVTSAPAKVTRTDGQPGEWARLTSSGTTDNQAASYIPAADGAAFVAASVPQNGDVIQGFVEVSITGTQMMPTIRIEGRLSAAIQYFAMNRAETFAAGTGLLVPNWSGVICTPPVTWYGGHNGMGMYLQQYLHNGAMSAVCDFGRVYIGTAPDLYSVDS